MFKQILQLLAASGVVLASLGIESKYSVAESTRDYFAAIENMDLNTIASLQAPDFHFSVPFSFSGALTPAVTVNGSDAMIQYLANGFAGVSSFDYRDEDITVAEGGKTTFLQCTSRQVLKSGGLYQQRYIYRIDWNDEGLITNLMEYINTVTFCLVLGSDECPQFA
ncbi:hypothetical protein F5884DRAFT_759562 [Xylogone sp. PMI_703]|nr:hypothetical protein F5884DRAFT_759562 [Xylogone sp. PMI_703]